MSKPAKAKKYVGLIKMYLNAGQAKPAPPVGPALGQAGLNLMGFCKDFNAKTADIRVSANSIVTTEPCVSPEPLWGRPKTRAGRCSSPSEDPLL